MQYAQLGKTNLKVSIMGIGGVPLNEMDFEATKEIIDFGSEFGINLIDIFMASSEVRSNIGKSIMGKREKFIIQGHIGTIIEADKTVRTRNLQETQESFENLLKELQTDYIDIGMLFFVDSPEDFHDVFETEIIEYAQQLKATGKIKALGMGSHNPKTALKAVKTGLLDVLMFSINPGYDLEKHDVDIYTLLSPEKDEKKEWSIDPERQKLYITCEEMGVGINVMKTLGAGTLLSAESSPFAKALSPTQCINYALNRPGVASVILGFKNTEEIKEALKYLNATEEEKSYSHIFTGQDGIIANGRCMYCNHCQPCPSMIDIAAVMKLLDMAKLQKVLSPTVVDHYGALAKNADDCVLCGDCEKNCPFGVSVCEKMTEAQAIF
ncbi:MAG: aldo/keto reductase [Clostridiales bacterium]